MEQVIIQTPRLRLRPWRDEDKAPFRALNADPRVMQFFPSLLSAAESDAVERFRLDQPHAASPGVAHTAFGFLAMPLRS